jgi:AraC-like DNA-binding protein
METASVRSLQEWQERISEYVRTPAGFTALGKHGFEGQLRARSLDVVRVLHLEAAPHRLQGHARDADPSYRLVLPVAGRVEIAQESRTAIIEPGHFAVLDTALSSEARFDEHAALTMIQIPRPVIGIPPVLVREITAVSIGGDDRGDLIGIVVPMLVRLADDLLVSNRHSPVRLAYNLTDLLTTVLLEHLSVISPAGSPQRLMLEITAFVDAHLRDAQLSAETVAAAHYISPRYLRKLFAGQETKVSEWIRSRRLELCRRDLVDPMLAADPISVIAARWGFSDPAHFSRLFKATYGLGPRQQRRDGIDLNSRDDPAE